MPFNKKSPFKPKSPEHWDNDLLAEVNYKWRQEQEAKRTAAAAENPEPEIIPESEATADVTNPGEESENPVEDVVTNPDVGTSNDEQTAGLRTAPTPDSKKSEALAGEPPT